MHKKGKNNTCENRVIGPYIDDPFPASNSDEFCCYALFSQ